VSFLLLKIHEGVRAGHIDVVKYLIDNGADVNARTGTSGGTSLYLAKQTLEEDHPMIAFLESMGALEIGPDL
jgi:ankyrin repeat protein